jgi:hypothetical protein
MNNQLKGCCTAAVVFLLTACSGGLPGSAGEVQLRTAEQLKGCENVGATHVSVVDRLGQPDWSSDRVVSELRKLAKNGAVQLGGNTIVEMTEVIDGTQSFTVFSCPD